MMTNLALLSSLTVIIIVLPWQLESLLCHRCLALSCSPSSDDLLCNSARDYIVQQLRDYYYIGNYLEPCPDPDDGISWRLLELQNKSPCEEERQGHATCTLGRLELIATNNLSGSNDPAKVLIHGTVLGCGKTNLIKEIAAAKVGNNCSYFESAKRLASSSYNFNLEVEHCPNLSDYCTVDHCVSAGVSDIRPFKHDQADSSFEYGTIIAILVVIVIIFIVVIAAALCRNPLNNASNYSPASAQEASTVSSVRSVDAINQSA